MKFEISEKELETCAKWQTDHVEEKHPPRYNEDGLPSYYNNPRWSFSYIFSPTNIGIKKVTKCSLCGEEKDVSDYDMW